MDSTDTEVLEDVGKGVLSLVAVAFPPAAPFIALAEQIVPALIAAQPDIAKAVQAGQSALDAGEAASPGFKDLLAKMLSLNSGPAVTTPHAENVVRSTLKLPPMTSDQADAWGWDDRWKNDANSGG